MAEVLIEGLSAFHPALTIGPEAFYVLVTVEAVSIAGAAIRVLDGVDKIDPLLEVLRIRVRPEEDLIKEIEAQEEFVGVAEIARALGVSKQRASELFKLGRLPRPAARLRSGPIWRLAEVRQALGERWKAPAVPAGSGGSPR